MLVLWFQAVVLCSTTMAASLSTFFDDGKVHEIRITFQSSKWYDELYTAHATDPNDPYFRATISMDGASLNPVGVRFKGDASFYTKSVKKPFKIDINVFDDGLDFHGLKKLELNNGWNDPTLLREKMFLDFAAKVVPAARAVHCRVYVNGVYWGLYLAVEEIDKPFVRSRFGNYEDGNLYQGLGGVEGQQGSDLTWLGSAPAAYAPYYGLGTKDTAADYADLIKMTDVLSKTPAAQLPAAIEPILDVNNALYGVALNNLFVNLDSYNGSTANYFVYDRQDTGQFVHLHWAAEHAFARSVIYVTSGQDPLRLDPLWLPVAKAGQMAQNRPLMSGLWAVDSYKRAYLRMLAQMLRTGFDSNTMALRINHLADLIRVDAYADTNKLFSNADFDKNLTANVYDGNKVIYGLLYFVDQRSQYMHQALTGLGLRSDIRINEVVTINTSGATDTAGEVESWVELTNVGPGKVSLAGLYLTDDATKPTKWALPAVDVNDGKFQVFWLDGESGEGATHASFAVKGASGKLFLYDTGGALIDSVSFTGLTANQAWGRYPDGTGPWMVMDSATPGSANKWTYKSPHLYINELMASNKHTIADERGKFDDWLEIYNGEAVDVDMGGMFMGQDVNSPGKWWEIPRGVHIPAQGYLLFWADNEPNEGNTHMTFGLSKSGEAAILIDTTAHGNVVIDKVTFGAQTTDVSYGRRGDGGAQWRFMTTPTPGRANPK
jgi:spore coat protein CotH